MALDRDRLFKPARKLRKLVKKIDRNATPEQVHDLRTNTLRFEASFEALAEDAPPPDPSLMKKLKRCRKRAGKVRDMDVLTSFASTIQPREDQEKECAVRLLEYLGRRRRKLAKKLQAEVQQNAAALRKDLRQAPLQLDKKIRQNGEVHGGKIVTPNAAAAAVKLAMELADPPQLSRQNLHPYRLKIKELRNVLRVSGDASHAKFTEDLGDVKDAIGEWHDWEKLAALAQEALDHGSRCGVLAELKRIAKQKYDHALGLALELRKNYLRSSATTSTKLPREPVWEAIATLAG